MSRHAMPFAAMRAAWTDGQHGRERLLPSLPAL